MRIRWICCKMTMASNQNKPGRMKLLQEVEGHLAENADGFEAYKGPDCADFRLIISITETESFNYWLTSKLHGMGEGYIIDEVQIRKGADLDSLISESVGRFGKIEELIKAREDSHPWPARNPTFEVTVDPDEISPQEGSDSSVISVKVFHCNGKLAGARQIIYYSRETARGTVNTYMGTGAESTGGALTAKYKLDYSKGTHPGKDIVEIWTKGYCEKKYTTEAVIKIKPRDGFLEIEKNSSSFCRFENRCVVQLPFEMIESEDSDNYEIRGGESNRISYKEKCRGCNEITGTLLGKDYRGHARYGTQSKKTAFPVF